MNLPPELVKTIGYAAPRLLFTCREYAALACPDVKYTYMISIGYNIKFSKQSIYNYIYWRKSGEYHKIDGPAVECVGYSWWWFNNGKQHRLDGPAFWRVGSGVSWYQDGRLHRVGGPANVHPRYSEWYINGKLHNDDGPAVVCSSGRVRFYVGGRRVKM